MSDHQYRHEPILYGWRRERPYCFVKDRTQSSVFEVDKPAVSDLHPTTKPNRKQTKHLTDDSATRSCGCETLRGSSLGS